MKRQIFSYLFMSFSFFLLGRVLFSAPSFVLEKESTLSGIISKINKNVGLVRIRTKSPLIKFLNPKDKIEFWAVNGPGKRCQGKLVNKSSSYLLVRVRNYALCQSRMSFTVGSSIHYFSPFLKRNALIAQEVVDILLKKKLALESRLRKNKFFLEGYLQDVETLQGRYKVLQEKLELELQEKLTLLEEDRVTALQNYKELEKEVEDVEYKIHLYSPLKEEGQHLDWSLESHLYSK